MLSLEKCRGLISNKKSLSDSELIQLRDQLYGLADVGITTCKSVCDSNVQIQQRLTDKERESWKERAAIMEFDGDLPRPIAERMAFEGFRKRGLS